VACVCVDVIFFFFFFQAEDGIRDFHVTGVQTCALPIWLEKARLTACRTGQDSVYLNAREVTLDHATGVGEAKHMSVRFFRVPIFYFPRVTFPINGERKTGFLFPSIGTSDRSGTIVEIPYYINIAPHMDATVNMRYLSDRGVQVMGEYRYLGERHDGIVRGEFLPGDDVYGDDRYAWGY